jgi:hyperosmotically inducible periplasmic protein
MKRTVLLISTILAATPVFAQQKSNDQVTEEGREKNTEYVSDATLTTKVHTALANDVGMRTMYSINVDSDQGVVTLKGKVDSQATKQRAEEVAKRVSGVNTVKNELQVKG